MKRLVGVAIAIFACAAAPALAAGPAPQDQQLVLAANKNALQISVDQDGWYRVSTAALRKAGFPLAQLATAQLFADGVQVPMKVKNKTIEFYGRALDTQETDTHVYWLVPGTKGLRIPVVRAGANPATPTGSFTTSIELFDRINYNASVLNGPDKSNWFGHSIFAGRKPSFNIPLQHVDPNAAASIKVTVQGLSLTNHVVKVELNGVPLGSINFAQQEQGISTFPVPAGTLKEGDNALTATSAGGELDFDFFVSLKLTYQHLYVADGNALSVVAKPGTVVSVAGFTSAKVRVFDVTHPARPRELAARVAKAADGTYSAGILVPARTTRLIFAADAKIAAPAAVVRNRASSIHAFAEGADEVVIAYRPFIANLGPLVQFRERQGLKVTVVDVQDLYDEYTFGAHTADAIKQFLAWTRDHWQRVPKYVLLVGDASFDPRNFGNHGFYDFVPTMYIDSTYIESPADDALADFDNDGVPEMAVGRLPVRTTQDTATVVAKILGYEGRPAKPNRDVLLVADKNIGYDFESAAKSLYGLIPPGVTVNTVFRSQGPTDAAVRTRLLQELNRGPTVVNFFGHGSVDIWTNGTILQTNDASKLGNQAALSLYMMMTCLNGYFVDPVGSSLGEALVDSPGGAIAVWASTGLTTPGDQVLADQKALGLLLSNPTETLGQAMVQGKAAIHDIDVRHTWMLIGDPATTLH